MAAFGRIRLPKPKAISVCTGDLISFTSLVKRASIPPLVTIFSWDVPKGTLNADNFLF